MKRTLFSAGLALALVGVGSSVAWADVATVSEQNLTEIVELQPGVSAEEMAEAISDFAAEDGLTEEEASEIVLAELRHQEVLAEEEAAYWANSRLGKDKYSANFATNRKTGHTGAKNCSKLVWSAYLLKSGLDIDSDKGAGVYPRNIRNSGYTVSYKTLKW